MSGPHTTRRTVPWIVADFEFLDETFLVVLLPEDDYYGDRWMVYQADLPWYWKSQPYEDHRV